MDLAKMTIENEKYRHIVYTGKLQLVLMSLKPSEDIPWEIHQGDQFIRVEQGIAKVIVGYHVQYLTDDDFVIIPPGKKHYVKNVGNNDLKLYAIYSPPEH